jgi:xylulose-5-phosphate/fructose-6-phosphate phosphoketolase
VIDRLPQLEAKAGYIKQARRVQLIEHREYICQNSEDLPGIRDWRWEK